MESVTSKKNLMIIEGVWLRQGRVLNIKYRQKICLMSNIVEKISQNVDVARDFRFVNKIKKTKEKKETNKNQLTSKG